MTIDVLRALCLVLALSGCTGRGIVLTSSGVVDNTPENARAHVCTLIASDLNARLGPQARAEVAIAEMPRWSPEGSRRSEGWYWDRASVQIDVVGAAVVPTYDVDAPREVVNDRLRPAVLGGPGKVLLRVSAVADEARFAALAAVSPHPAAGPTSPSAPVADRRAPERTARTYTVQAGDTLADLSTAFYGTPQHWRTIRDANPSIDAGALQPGDRLTIPLKP